MSFERFNVVFDLGGVVLTWDPAAILHSVLTEAGPRDVVRREVFEHDDWQELDRGTLSPDIAQARFAARTGLSPHDIGRLMDRVAPSLTPIAQTLDLIRRIKARGHRLFCLSNMHLQSIRYLEQQYDFWHLFDGIVISSYIHMIKPEPEIYTHLLTKHNLRPDETVFIDDLQVNLDAAAEQGIRTVRFVSPHDCESCLRAVLEI